MTTAGGHTGITFGRDIFGALGMIPNFGETTSSDVFGDLLPFSPLSIVEHH